MPMHGTFGGVDSAVIMPAAASGVVADLYHFTTNLNPTLNSSELDSLIAQIEHFLYPPGATIPDYTMRLHYGVPNYLFKRFARQEYTAALTSAHRAHLGTNERLVYTRAATR